MLFVQRLVLQLQLQSKKKMQLKEKWWRKKRLVHQEKNEGFLPVSHSLASVDMAGFISE